MSETIEHIIFDLGNVIVPLDWSRAYQKLTPLLSPHHAETLQHNRRAFESLLAGPAIGLETGAIDFQEFKRRIVAALDLSVSVEVFHDIWCDIFTLDTDMVRLGEALSVNYGTWLASNTSEAHYRWIMDRYPSVVFYRKAALSYELGVMKPAALYFERAVELFGIRPSRAVFIDDSSANVEAAVNIGIKGVVFEGIGQLTEELRELDVKVPTIAGGRGFRDKAQRGEEA